MALAAILSESGVWIATDTLIRHPYKPGDEYVRPYGFASKVHQLPQYKACFSSLGNPLVGTSFYLFVTQRVIGNDLKAIIEIDPRYFVDYLNAQHRSGSPSGAIYLFGFNLTTKKMQGYFLIVNSPDVALKWESIEIPEALGSEFVVIPSVESVVDRLPGGLATNRDVVVEIAKLQRIADGFLPVDEQMGIAGEIFVTEIGVPSESERFQIHTEHVYTWADYPLHFRQLVLNSGVEETARQILHIPVNPEIGRTGREN